MSPPDCDAAFSRRSATPRTSSFSNPSRNDSRVNRCPDRPRPRAEAAAVLPMTRGTSVWTEVPWNRLISTASTSMSCICALRNSTTRARGSGMKSATNKAGAGASPRGSWRRPPRTRPHRGRHPFAAGSRARLPHRRLARRPARRRGELPRHALPAPFASEPRRQPPACAKEGLVWVPTAAPEDMTEVEAGVYDGLSAVNIHRALSLVPAEVTGFFDPDTVHCVPDAVLRTSAPNTGRSPGLGVPAAPLGELPTDVAKSCNPNTTREEPMPNGGSDCCGTCWFNRSLEGQRGSANFNREIPSHCEIRDLDVPDPFYTYCANHPCHRPDRDPVPIGPVYVHRATGPLGEGGREEWQPSPDTEEIRQHLLDIVRLPEEHADEGYHFHTRPAHIEALMQLLGWHDERLVPALEEIARRPEAEPARADIEETMRLVRERLGI